VGIFPQRWQLFLNGSLFASKVAAFFNSRRFAFEAMWPVKKQSHCLKDGHFTQWFLLLLNGGHFFQRRPLLPLRQCG
jgi:hypothetical protein